MFSSKFFLITCLMSVLVSGYSFAEDLTGEPAQRVERRSEYTKNKVIVSVGPCAMAETYVDAFDTKRVRSQFTMTVCQEQKEFDVNVLTTGKWYNWSSKVTPVEGSETYNYLVTNETNGADEKVDEDALLQGLSVYRTCEQMRAGYVAAAEASRGTAKCKF